MHGDKHGKKEQYTCPQCSVDFQSRQELDNHKKMEHQGQAKEDFGTRRKTA